MTEIPSRFEEDLKIDPMALDVEWWQQPQIFMRYSEQLAKASRELDRLKQKFDVVQAQVDNRIRNTYAEKKPTETAIRSMLLQDAEVIKISEALSDQKFEVDLLTSAVRAFDQRKTALENLVRLQAQNYFAAPKEGRDFKSECEKKTQKNEALRRMAIAGAARS